MKYSDLQPGLKLELEVFNLQGEKIEHQLISQLEWIEDDNTGVIATPIFEGALYPIRIGWGMNVYFIFKDNLYTFSSKVSSTYSKDNISLLKIVFQGEIRRIQRRQFFRFECCVPIKYRIVASTKPEYNEGILFTDTFSRDLSGSGVCIATEEKMLQNQLVELLLPLENSKEVNFFGRVVRSVKPEYNDLKYETGLSFYDIQYKEREAIIGFIFREQRKLRKKGLI
ncbi:MAG: flagellar brake protein [Clostridia bacterium]|nr:flagellar brake protein [Clostridia bacterium]